MRSKELDVVEMFHFGCGNVKGHIRKHLSVNIALTQPHIWGAVGAVIAGKWELLLICRYVFIISLSRWPADWDA